MTSVEHASALLLDTVRKPKRTETLSLFEGHGRVLAEDVVAEMNQPPFDRSPLDGYAVNHHDLQGATRETPVELHVVQSIYAGEAPGAPIERGEASRVATGAPIPQGATCIVRKEDTDQGEEKVHIFVSHKKFENYCHCGEDISSGQKIMSGGERLDCSRLGILASQGHSDVQVFLRPKILIVSTGNELVAPGNTLSPGKIFDSNSYTLAARAMEVGAVVERKATSVYDDPVALSDTIIQNIDAGFIVTTGGVSVGTHDYMPRVAEIIGATMLFKGISAKPGGPAMAFKKDNTLVLCLSGNPFAAFATFELLAVPVLRKLAGEIRWSHKTTKAKLMSDYLKDSRGRRFLRARYEDGRVYFTGGGHSSGILSSLVDCNCFIDIPPGTHPLKKGSEVNIILF
jgi:molybdopterin molybdotransferase